MTNRHDVGRSNAVGKAVTNLIRVSKT